MKLQSVVTAGLIAAGYLVVAFGVLIAGTKVSDQPIEYNHKKHVDYFRGGDHRQEGFDLHREALGEIPEELKKGECLECHDSFEEAAEDIPRIKVCAGCHSIFLSTDLRERPEIRPCVGCHRGVASPYYRATIPNIEICAACHEKPRTQSAEEEKLRKHIERGRQIPWRPVYDYLLGDIVFSHERHVMLGRIECRECHGDVGSATRPPNLEIEFSMEECIACHKSRGASQDCLSCHK